MKYFAPFVLMGAVFLCSCAQTRKVDVDIKNDTDIELVVTGRMGIFSKEKILKPGERWVPWIYPDMIKNVKITIRKKK